MSHSQFHSTNLFILRHAWLNLWDKHMTTGRINQVTTFPACRVIKHLQWAPYTRCWPMKANNLSRWEFISDSNNKISILVKNNCSQINATNVSLTADQNRLVPRSHILQTHCSLSVLQNKNHGLLRELPATSEQNKSAHQVEVDSQV
jgi:hypothetical protein